MSIKKSLSLLGFSLLLVFFACKETPNATLNPIIGNAGIEHFYATQSFSTLDEKQRVTAHLTYVYNLLSERTLPMPKSETRSKRLTLLEHLKEYISRGHFPINSKYDERRPCFIDENGTYCAVGYLIQQTAGAQLAEKINALFQYDYLMNMKLPELTSWVKASGFTLEELATIQPTYGTFVLKNSFGIGAGMSLRGVENGYPSFRLSYGTRIGENLQALHSRVEMMGHRSFYSSLSYRYGFKLSQAKPIIRNRGLSVQIGPGLLVDSGRRAWLLKPEVQFNLFSFSLFKRTLAGVVSYAYDLSLTNPDLFRQSRHDLAFHLIYGRTKGGVIYSKGGRRRKPPREGLSSCL
jgi:hypothetical protein